jgi:hypothetical protein
MFDLGLAVVFGGGQGLRDQTPLEGGEILTLSMPAPGICCICGCDAAESMRGRSRGARARRVVVTVARVVQAAGAGAAAWGPAKLALRWVEATTGA